MSDLVIRPMRADEADLFLSLTDSLPDTHLVGRAWAGVDFRELLRKHEYRPEWTWVALRDGVVVARAAWWGGPDDAEPLILDWYDFTDADAGERLLRNAPPRTDFCLVLPPGWRDSPAVRHAATVRIEAARHAGMRLLVERLHYTWTVACGVPADPGRLEFRAEPDDELILDVLRRVHSVTLDAHALRAIAERGGLDAAARDELEFLRWLPSPRDWWQLAFTRSGGLVGITVPGRNYASPVIGFIGVAPEHRGQRYGYDLLVAATRRLAAEGVAEIAAATDITNPAMAAAFARAGYPITQERVYLAW
jgi:RimJ/RimL family protein N-acetyltransferase